MAATQPDPPRKDVPRRFEGMLDDGLAVLNGDSARSYVLVYNDERSVQKYELQGYELERHRPGGPRLQIHSAAHCKKHEGKPIEGFGHALYSMDSATLADRRKRGGRGHGVGTDAWDQIEQRLRTPTGIDPLLGTHSNHISVSPLEG